MKITIGQLKQVIKEATRNQPVPALSSKKPAPKKPAHELAWEREFTLFTREEAEQEFPEAFTPESDFEYEADGDANVYFTWEMIGMGEELCIVDASEPSANAISFSSSFKSWGVIEHDSMDKSSRKAVVKMAKEQGKL